MIRRFTAMAAVALLFLTACADDPDTARTSAPSSSAEATQSPEPSASEIPDFSEVDWTKVVDDLDCNPANLGVELIEVRYADVRGTGVPDPFVQVDCQHQQSVWPHQLEVFDGSSDPAEPTQVAVLVPADDHQLIRNVTFGPSTVTVEARGYSPKDGLCCPSIVVNRTFRWDGKAFIEQ